MYPLYPFDSTPNVPPYNRLVSQKTISVASSECIGPDIVTGDVGVASAAYTANLLSIIPLVVTNPTVVSQFYWINGGTVNGSTDVGIYTEDGATKLGSTGSTANSGTSQIQVVDITNFNIPANRRLWLVLGSDSGTQTYKAGNTVAGFLSLIGVKQQASGWSSGLPSSLTFAAPSVAYLPYFGFTGGTI